MLSQINIFLKYQFLAESCYSLGTHLYSLLFQVLGHGVDKGYAYVGH